MLEFEMLLDTVSEVVRLDGVMLTPALRGSELTANARVATNKEKEKRIFGVVKECRDARFW
jgi:hypothetical protein